jgi:hypothetical protein
MTSRSWDIQAQCDAHDAESFPLGAGGGGAVMVFNPFPDRLRELDDLLAKVFRRIDITLKPQGHMLENANWRPFRR